MLCICQALPLLYAGDIETNPGPANIITCKFMIHIDHNELNTKLSTLSKLEHTIPDASIVVIMPWAY